LTEAELRRVLEHIAGAGFDPAPTSPVGGRGSGIQWQGRILRGSDRLPPAEVHYIRHVLSVPEWPPGTTLDAYLESLRDVIVDDRSGVIVSRYLGVWQVTIARRSDSLRGPAGHVWVMVEYRVGFGHWVTAYQPRDLMQELQSPRRQDVQWLRRPR
jgi:hypothetical protein